MDVTENACYCFIMEDCLVMSSYIQLNCYGRGVVLFGSLKVSFTF